MKKQGLGLVLILISLFLITSCHKNTGNIRQNSSKKASSKLENVEARESALPPMLMLNGRLYKDLGYVNSAVTCGTADGEILSSVGPNQEPEKDGESNFGKGYEYQFWDEGHINLKMNDQWLIFEDISLENDLIPDSVANFKARVREVSQDSLLVEIIDIPPTFQWIFQNKEIQEIKPLSLSLENLIMEDGRKEVTGQGLQDKTIQVWFSGALKNTDPLLSQPLELEEVYRIIPLDQ